jgi:hypothetical protein
MATAEKNRDAVTTEFPTGRYAAALKGTASKQLW